MFKIYTMFSVALLALAASINVSGAQSPSAKDIIEALKSKSTRGTQAAEKPGASAAPKSASLNASLIETLKQKAARGLSVSMSERTALAQSMQSLPAIDLEVVFDFNASGISDRTRPLVMELGRALKDPSLAGSTFIVAGHTDRKGSASYNQRLSEQRANAVRDFLISHFDIPAERLIAVGYGFEQLKLPNQPYSDANRRVQVVNASSNVADLN